jgi:amidase
MKSNCTKNIIFLILLFTLACSQKPKSVISAWIPYDESAELAENAGHESGKMRFKLIQSKVLDKNEIWKDVSPQIKNFSEEDYQKYKPFIFEQDIPAIQSYIHSGALTYEAVTQWYLYRIVRFENDKNKFLNAIIDINPDAVSEARKRDRNKSAEDHPLYGMPVLLKDNINVEGMATTAGAEAMRNNYASDAFIVHRIKEKGGIILGKTNLSEWANFLSQNCPNGYSAVGGQTLNPYGRKIFDTGGSSSGSAVAMAANYAAAAVGTETSGSILSPSGKNSVAGLKPTIGLLSRSGIVPISGTYDTPGPITRNLIDNAILLSAMIGEDNNDPATLKNLALMKYWEELKTGTLKGLRFGVNKAFLTDSLYKQAIEIIVSAGGVAIEFEPEQINLENFSKVLGADMKVDLPQYLTKYASHKVKFRSVADIYDFNNKDSLIRIPYGQTLFKGIIKENVSKEDLSQLKTRLHNAGISYFENPMSEYKLDAILSISNRNAGYAAVAEYPCLTVPMGFTKRGEPSTLTFIARPFEEDNLLKMGFAFELATKSRKIPEEYK